MLNDSITIALTLLALLLLAKSLHLFVVQDVERALLIRRGRNAGELSSGVHWIFGWHVAVERFDAREQTLWVAPQEITTGDPMSIKVSATVRYRVADLDRVRRASTQHTADLHVITQLALRETIARHELESLLSDRSVASAQLLEVVVPRARDLGLEVVAAAVLDIVLRGELKQALGESLRARAEARGKLERARGETATLRHLSNTAKLLENNVGLTRLRLLDAVQRSAEGTNNALVLGLGKEMGLDLTSGKS